MKLIAQQGVRDAVMKVATIATPALVSVMLGCLVAFFRWSVAQHHNAELVAIQHSKAIEAVVEWQRQWHGYPTDSEDLIARAQKKTDDKMLQLQAKNEAAISLLSGQINALQTSIGELKGYVQAHSVAAKNLP